jgi:D-alanyl-D-alanine carboxypeptidase/D-alanyl-D-alanine-endopeptidase (penicillin-binding protein 4)
MVGINFHRIIVATLLTALSVASHAETTLGIAGEEATTIGIYIKDIRNNKVIVERNSKLALTPASTMKTVTTATALSLLGADFRFKTECKLVGDYVSGSKSKWYGDLIVYSCGDPTGVCHFRLKIFSNELLHSSFLFCIFVRIST